jgi:DNA polymerase
MPEFTPRQRQVLAALDLELWEARIPVPGVAMPPAAGVAAAPVEHAAPAAAAAAVMPPGPAVPAPSPVRAMDWGHLEEAALACTRCTLHQTRNRVVFGVGDREARWMVIGEAPGADEDRQGEPFVGRAGQLLNEMLRAAGVDRGQVYIANVLKCRPPENRDPKPEEAGSCEPFLTRQIELVRPRLLLAVGRIAAQALLHTDTPIGRLRGQVHHYAPTGTPLVVTYHPAYLLRSPGQKRRAWEDLLLARSVALPA